MRKPKIRNAKAKAQISFALTATLIRAYVFATRMEQFPSIFQIQTFKLIAILCDCTGLFVSDLFGNPDCWFSNDATQSCVVYV